MGATPRAEKVRRKEPKTKEKNAQDESFLLICQRGSIKSVENMPEVVDHL